MFNKLNYILYFTGSRAKSLQAPSAKDQASLDAQGRRPSLQPEHYHSLNVPSPTKAPNSSPQVSR